MSKTFLLYWVLTFNLGMCIGYYILPYLFKPSNEFYIQTGFIMGAKFYKNRIHEMGSFSTLSDSSIIIYIDGDSIPVYK